MKKFYAILLSIALVLGFASVASASDLKVTGEFEALAGYSSDNGWEGLDYDAANLYIGLTTQMGDNATGELKFGFDFNATGGDYFFVNLADFTYNVTDSFFVGYQYSERADGNPYRLYKGGDYCFANTIGNIFFATYDVVKAGYKFDGGQVTVYSDVFPDDVYFYAKGSYAADPLTFTAWLASEDVLTFVGSVDYKFSDALNVTGFLGDLDGDIVLGAKAKYVVEDMAIVEGRLEYDVNNAWFADALYDYNVKVTLTALGETFQPYAYYDDDDEFGIGFDYYLGASDLWAEYNSDAKALSIGLDLVF